MPFSGGLFNYLPLIKAIAFSFMHDFLKGHKIHVPGFAFIEKNQFSGELTKCGGCSCSPHHNQLLSFPNSPGENEKLWVCPGSRNQVLDVFPMETSYTMEWTRRFLHVLKKYSNHLKNHIQISRYFVKSFVPMLDIIKTTD